MRLDRMLSWLKALVFLVTLMGGFPSLAWAHAGHDHGNRALDLPYDLSSGSAVDVRPALFASAFEPSNKGGSGTLPRCCCQGPVSSCPTSSSPSLSGPDHEAGWDLAALVGRWRTMGGPEDTPHCPARHSLPDRPPKI